MTTIKLCDKPIFVLGAPRSGTTILAWSLAQHSGLWTSGESYVLAELFGGERGKKGIDLIFKTAEVLAEGSWITHEKVTRAELMASLGLGVNALFTSRSGQRRWIDHTPVQSLMASTLGEMFPQAQFLHSFRDGRAVVNSMVNFLNALEPHVRENFDKAGWKIPWLDFTEACRTWRRYAGTVLEFSENNPGRCLTVRQEDLVKDAATAMARVYDFLGVAAEDGPVHFIKTQRLHSSTTPPKDTAAQQPQPWKAWSIQQKEIFLKEAGPIYTRHGLSTEAQLRAELELSTP